MTNKTVFIHAGNVTGLGASQVVSSLVKALLASITDADVTVALPNQGVLASLDINCHKIIHLNHAIPNNLFRTVECLVPKLFYPSKAANIVLGDLPLRGLTPQIVLVHQPNLIKPEINNYSSNSIAFNIMRKLFKENLSYADTIIVQSEIMQEQLIASYPILQNKVEVIPQPAPDWFVKNYTITKKNHKTGLTLFYPAAGYPHKNHKIIEQLVREKTLGCAVKEFIITLKAENYVQEEQNMKIRNVGRLTPQRCMEYYKNVDALFFPSKMESYGLPLVEAMLMGLPIICADLPYSRWLCEDIAIYFNPDDIYDADNAINTTKEKIESGWTPDWHNSLKKIPSDWNDVAARFITLLRVHSNNPHP